MNIGNRKKNKGKGLSSSLPQTPTRGVLPCTIKGYLYTLAIGSVLTLLLAALVYSLSDPNRFVRPAALCILYICALLGGFLSAGFNRGSALLCGCLYACMMLATMLAVSLLFGMASSADRPIALSAGLHGAVVAVSIAGAMIGSHKPTSSRKRKNKHR